MKIRWAWMMPVMTMVALLLADAPARGQGYAPPGYAPSPYGATQAYDPGMAMYAQPGMMAAYTGPGGNGSVLAPGQPMPPMSMPGAGGPMMMGSPFDAYAEDFGSGMCPHCRGLGCRHCGGRGGLLGDVLGITGPYDDGGCCATRWYDFAVDYMYLSRDTVDRGVDLTSLGVGGPDLGNPIVLSTDQLDFDEASGFRFSGMFQVSAGGSVEFTYFGTFHWHKSASVSDPNGGLFSVVSDFGQFAQFAELDNATFQRIDYSSTFDNFEINFRRRWVAPNCRYQGSWLAGVRYFKLDEDFQYVSVADGTADFDVNTNNSLTGFQAGGDLWLCVVPGLRLGGEFKAGIFGNHASQGTTITATSLPEAFEESVVVNDVAFVSNLDLMMLYRLNYNWTFKLGYQFLFVDGVALASENFNPTPPAVFAGVPGNIIREETINDNGNVFYHGLMIGAEFLW
jgi:hypothetical protein